MKIKIYLGDNGFVSYNDNQSFYEILSKSNETIKAIFTIRDYDYHRHYKNKKIHGAFSLFDPMNGKSWKGFVGRNENLYGEKIDWK